LLLADEPTAALDDIQAKGAIALLTQHAAATDATLVVASHDARIRPEFEHVLSLSGRAAREPRIGSTQPCSAKSADNAAQRDHADVGSGDHRLLLASRQLMKACSAGPGIDLVVGAKGSPLQLILVGVYHLDVPPETLRSTRLKATRQSADCRGDHDQFGRQLSASALSARKPLL
jgi:energy-coupling factor transporter ATP-binding protein EcfA2